MQLCDCLGYVAQLVTTSCFILLQGLTFTLNKATSTLKINGSYKMHK